MQLNSIYSRYGLALLKSVYGFKEDSIDVEILKQAINEGKEKFRICPINNIINNKIQFKYVALQKGLPKEGIFLSPHIITTDKKANGTWNAMEKYLKLFNKESISLSTGDNPIMGIMPISGKLNNGKQSQGYSSYSKLEIAFCLITNITAIKPCFAHRTESGSYLPTTVIPDLEIDEMMEFIELFNQLLNTDVVYNDLMTAPKKEGKIDRPAIYFGNFKYAPKSSAFGVVGLLGSIGRWSIDAECSTKGKIVLESLKDKKLYIIQYGNAKSVKINHYIIDLAKENKLSEIVYSIQHSRLIHSFEPNSNGYNSRKKIFNLYASRFLELFTRESFNNFLSIRAEYSNKLIVLFLTFFGDQMKIPKDIVESAKSLGLWLNLVAYIVAKREAASNKKIEKLNDIKSKILIELESSVFGARKPSEVLNVIVRAGRLSGLDAPSESQIFEEAVLTGEINMDDAKSMLMAFARTKNNKSNPLESSQEVNDNIENVNYTSNKDVL